MCCFNQTYFNTLSSQVAEHRFFYGWNNFCSALREQLNLSLRLTDNVTLLSDRRSWLCFLHGPFQGPSWSPWRSNRVPGWYFSNRISEKLSPYLQDYSSRSTTKPSSKYANMKILVIIIMLLEFTKLILNSIQIEDVAELRVELWFIFFLFNWRGDGLVLK